MDFLESSLMRPSVPVDPVAPLRLKRKRGPAASDRPDPALGLPLLLEEDEQDSRGTVTLLGRVRRFAALCLWPEDQSEELLVPTDQQPGILSRLFNSLRSSVRSCCETIINGFIWSADLQPY